MDRKEMILALGQASMFFPNMDISEPMVDAWYDMFRHVRGEDFLQALKQACAVEGQRFFPTPGEVMAQLRKIVYGANLSAEEAFKLAFQHVVSNKPNFKQLSDMPRGDAILEAIDIIGREGIFNDGMSINPFVRKDFVKVYEGLLEKQLDFEKSELLGLLPHCQIKLIN